MSRVGIRLLTIGMLLSIVGVIVVTVGIFMNSLGTSVSGSASFGGVVLIGPIPMVFGTDRTAVTIGIIGAIIIMAAWLAFLLVRTRRLPQGSRHSSET